MIESIFTFSKTSGNWKEEKEKNEKKKETLRGENLWKN